ncbi:MAG TPA: HIT domain-containing protein [Stellaceae bacterium]|nr:HIT domain-containing protein [Stellaceae bacterium]
MLTDPDCIFCKIVAGTMPSVNLYEDAETLAFMDINPVHDGHSLVIPKAHFATVFVIAPDVVAAVARTTAIVATAVNAALQPDGLNLVQSNGRGAAQSVDHFHMHVLPRHLDDHLPINWPLKPGDMAHIADIAARIRARL